MEKVQNPSTIEEQNFKTIESDFFPSNLHITDYSSLRDSHRPDNNAPLIVCY